MGDSADLNINGYLTTVLIIMAVFYAIYLGKMLSQKKKGIQTDQMARGKSDKKRIRTEGMIKAATYGSGIPACGIAGFAKQNGLCDAMETRI